MKIRNILIFASLFALIQCSPKTTEPMMKDATKEMSNVDHSWRSLTPSAGPARKINMGDFNVEEMENGLTLIVVENHKLPRVSYSLSLKNDQINEDDQAGIVSFAGDLMGRGTTTKSKAELDAAIDFLGANFSTFGSGMFGSSLTKHQDKLLEIMSDVLMNPSFPKEEFDKILKQSLSGIESSKTDPNAMARNVASVVNFGTDHPYGEIETSETYNNIKLADCKRYIKNFFKPNNAYLTIVGDITFEEAKIKAAKYFGDWKSGMLPKITHETPEGPESNRVCLANKDGAVQSVIRITYPVENKPGNPDIEKVSVMNNILGGGIFSGRLMQNLREDKAYTYGARSNIGSDNLISSFNAFASVRTEVTDSSIVQFLYEMNRMVNEPVDAGDLQLVKNSMTGSFARSLESPQTLARFARNIHKYNLPTNYYETYLERLDAVSIADVQNAAKKFIRPNQANIVVVGSKDDIAEKLVQFDADGELEFFDNFGNKLEMKETALPSDINGEVVINDYINKLGGKAKIEGLESLELHFSMSMMGQSMGIDQYYQKPNSFYMKVGNEQMVMQEMKFDGTKAAMSGMGGSQTASEGPIYDQAKAQSKMFDQLDYLSDGYTLEVKGIEDVNGESCYKVSVQTPGGDKITEFYSVKTSLLMKTVSNQEGPNGQAVTISNELSDYKEIDGIPFPHKIKTMGAMPMPIEMTMTDAKVNPTLDAELFSIK
ncbi:MAG: insulinase family protein [Saprospiraceae bacterium]|nr:insulinase family protein [Saprospiraceae bacterium]